MICASFKSAFWPLLMPVIILSGIYGGIFTPTEAAVVAVVYGLIVGFAYRELSLARPLSGLPEGGAVDGHRDVHHEQCGVVRLADHHQQIPQTISSYLAATRRNQAVYLLFVNILLLLAGCIMNAAAAIVIFTSILYPAAMSFGIDPIVLGVIMAVNLSIGTVTPPLGVDLFIASAITKVPLERIVVAIVALYRRR